MFGDKVFDSVNASSLAAVSMEHLKNAITNKSPHVPFWYEAIKVLNTMKAIKNGREFVPPTIKNWVKTLHGFIYLCTRISFLCTRNVNQDPLIIYFGCIRSHGVRNINSTCSSFIASYKTLIINNFMASHSPGANCEDDACDGVLESLKDFILANKTSPDIQNINIENFVDPTFNLRPKTGKYIIEIETHEYIAGFLAKKILKAVKGCKICKNGLTSSSMEEL